jgi:N-acetylglucosamine kinase-like BadF-type ATPase
MKLEERFSTFNLQLLTAFTGNWVLTTGYFQMTFFLGIDIGNTKSHALISDANGHIVALGQGGQGNHEVVGREGLETTLHEIVRDALQQSGLQAHDISGVGFGIAGFDWESDRPLHDEVIATLGIHAPYKLVNDAVLGLVGGASEGWGVVITAGTSCNARGRDLHGHEGRITGNGAWFGEFGGGIELVYKGIELVSRAWSLRGAATILCNKYVAHTGAKDTTDLLEGLARGRYHLKATDAPLIFEAAQEGDTVARDAIIWLGSELANLGIGIVRQLKLEHKLFEVVLAGSLYKGTPLIQEVLMAQLHTVAPLAVAKPLKASPVVGGVFLGMEAAGVPFVPIRERVIEETQSFVVSR